MRGFSFDGMVEQFYPVVGTDTGRPDALGEAPADPDPAMPGGLAATLASTYGITEREMDVYRLLAHGRNARSVEGALVISHNTVQSHVRRIYGKLGVHSQQELIDLHERLVVALPQRMGSRESGLGSPYERLRGIRFSRAIWQ